MDIPVNWSPSAVLDLEEIAHYIAKDSATYAASFVSHTLRVASQLRSFPQSGKVVQEIADPNIRERIITHYRLIYRLRESDILILALIHGKRLIPETINSEMNE
jgi:plasmid stabilization system protein ParE